MKFQQTPFTCGPAAVLNAFLCLGMELKATEKQIAKLCGTTKDGSDDFDVAIAVALLGFDVGKTLSIEDVNFYLDQGRPVMLVAYEDTHWVTIGGRLGKDKWIVIDSDNAGWNKRHNGVYVVEPEALRCKDGVYLGIAILGQHKRVSKVTKRPGRSKKG